MTRTGGLPAALLAAVLLVAASCATQVDGDTGSAPAAHRSGPAEPGDTAPSPGGTEPDGRDGGAGPAPEAPDAADAAPPGTPAPEAGQEAGLAPAADEPASPQPDQGGDARPGEASGPRDEVEASRGFPFEATVTPRCATRGATVRVEVATRPRAAIAAAVAFADDQAHGTFTVGDADRDGAWSWQFVVPPQAPDGEASVLLSAQDRTWTDDGETASTTGEHATGRYRFEVRTRC